MVTLPQKSLYDLDNAEITAVVKGMVAEIPSTMDRTAAEAVIPHLSSAIFDAIEAAEKQNIPAAEAATFISKTARDNLAKAKTALTPADMFTAGGAILTMQLPKIQDALGVDANGKPFSQEKASLFSMAEANIQQYPPTHLPAPAQQVAQSDVPAEPKKTEPEVAKQPATAQDSAEPTQQEKAEEAPIPEAVKLQAAAAVTKPEASSLASTNTADTQALSQSAAATTTGAASANLVKVAVVKPAPAVASTQKSPVDIAQSLGALLPIFAQGAAELNSAAEVQQALKASPAAGEISKMLKTQYQESQGKPLSDAHANAASTAILNGMGDSLYKWTHGQDTTPYQEGAQYSAEHIADLSTSMTASIRRSMKKDAKQLGPLADGPMAFIPAFSPVALITGQDAKGRHSDRYGNNIHGILERSLTEGFGTDAAKAGLAHDMNLVQAENRMRDVKGNQLDATDIAASVINNPLLKEKQYTEEQINRAQAIASRAWANRTDYGGNTGSFFSNIFSNFSNVMEEHGFMVALVGVLDAFVHTMTGGKVSISGMMGIENPFLEAHQEHTNKQAVVDTAMNIKNSNAADLAYTGPANEFEHWKTALASDVTGMTFTVDKADRIIDAKSYVLNDKGQKTYYGMSAVMHGLKPDGSNEQLDGSLAIVDAPAKPAATITPKAAPEKIQAPATKPDPKLQQVDATEAAQAAERQATAEAAAKAALTDTKTAAAETTTPPTAEQLAFAKEANERFLDLQASMTQSKATFEQEQASNASLPNKKSPATAAVSQ